VEKGALAQLDIPAFTLRGDATELVLGERSVRLARSGLDVARSRLSSLNSEDMERQLSIVRASFALRYFAEPVATPSNDVAAAVEDAAREARPISRGEISAAAMEIAAEIARRALVDCRGEVTWVTAEPISTAGHARLQATGYGLYDGLAGIAIFLAAAARCGGDPAMALLARRALSPVRDRLRTASPTYVDEYGIGGACGAASAIYALLRAGTLLSDDAVVDDALYAARLLTPESIERDTSFDVLYGGAGAILALLALHKVRRSDALLELAHRCGRHLLARRRTVRCSKGITHQLWPTVGDSIHIGFAHGSAGIALALLRLHAATGIAAFVDAALDAVRHEDSLLRIARRRPSLADTEPEHPRGRRARVEVPANWCRGLAGIGLARLACTAGSHAAELRSSAERALADALRAGDSAIAALDGACCGASGCIELLLAAGLRWGDAGLLSAAHGRASEMVRRGRAAGRYRLSASPGAQIYDPSLYRGTAGIGYGLLRLCHPELLPSFLSWD
jgi:type 2 lantibiotic biosynthesis protein LanM